jgi:hypothetical protein
MTGKTPACHCEREAIPFIAYNEIASSLRFSQWRKNKIASPLHFSQWRKNEIASSLRSSQ